MMPGDDKAVLRARCLERRKELHAAAVDAGKRARDHFLKAVGFPDGAAVSAYVPVRSEFDVLPLAEAAHARGHAVGMPVVAARNAPLAFRAWTPGDALETGPLNIPAPPPDAPGVTPNLLFVPMMAFDSCGYRLGYGGGYYDRTLAALRRDVPGVIAVGVCYAGLEIGEVPRDDHDARLDWIVTEEGVRSTWEKGR